MYNNSNKWGYSLLMCCTAKQTAYQQCCAARTIVPPNLNLDYVVKSTSKINQVTMNCSYVEPLVPSLVNCHGNKYFSHWYWSTLAKKHATLEHVYKHGKTIYAYAKSPVWLRGSIFSCCTSDYTRRILFQLKQTFRHFSIKANVSALMQVPSSDALKMHCKRHLHMCQNICFLWKKYSASVFMHRNHNVNFDTNVLYSNLLHLKTTNIM